MSEAWGRTTCLQLALGAEDMKFVSHGGVQVTSGARARGRAPACSQGTQPLLSRTAHVLTRFGAPGPQGGRWPTGRVLQTLSSLLTEKGSDTK